MFQPVSLFIGYRYSRSRNRSGFVSFITFFSVAGIMLGVAALITVVSVMNGFEGELKKRILGIVPHVVVSLDKPSINQSDRDSLLAAEKILENDPQTLSITPFIEQQALVVSNTSLLGVQLQGIEADNVPYNMAKHNMVAGSFEQLALESYTAVIGESLARKLDIRVGESIRLVLPATTRFTPMGRIPAQRVFKVVGFFNAGSQVDDSVVYVDHASAAKLLRRKGDGFQKFRVYLRDAFEASHYIQRHQGVMPDGIHMNSWQKSQGTLFSAVKMEKNMMRLMLSLIVAVAAFNIVSALVMVVIDKRGEIAILRTCGMSRGAITRVFISQGMINGVWGTILGVIFGILLATFLNPLLSMFGLNILGGGYASQQLPMDLRSLDVVTIGIAALVMTFLATLYPAYQASRTQPAEVLRNE